MSKTRSPINKIMTNTLFNVNCKGSGSPFFLAIGQDRLMFNRSTAQDLNGANVKTVEGGKLEYPEKNPLSQIEIDKSQPTCGAQDSIPGRRRGRRD